MVGIVLQNVTRRWGAFVGVNDINLVDRRPGVPGAARAVRLRQDHDHAHDRRAGGPVERHDQHRRAGRERPGAQGPRRGDGVPELRPLPEHERLRQHLLPAEGAEGRRRRSTTPACAGRPRWSSSRTCSTAFPRELSGGQRQRVALARAVVREPAVFLMDEPLSNLDAKLRVSTRAQIKHLQHELAVTTVYVTHDQIEAMTLADRVVVMNKGVIQQVGTPTEIYEPPANTFVAGFIGSPAMNLLMARSTTAPSSARQSASRASPQSPSRAGHPRLPGRGRPRDRAGCGPDLSAPIYAFELLGDATLVTVQGRRRARGRQGGQGLPRRHRRAGRHRDRRPAIATSSSPRADGGSSRSQPRATARRRAAGDVRGVRQRSRTREGIRHEH